MEERGKDYPDQIGLVIWLYRGIARKGQSRGKATMMNEILDWARLAMAVDCEGCITISRSYFDQKKNGKPYWRLQSRLIVGNTVKALPLWMVSRFGGKVYAWKNTGCKGKRFYEWRPNGGNKRIEELLVGMLPYLLIKPEQAHVLLEFIHLPKGVGTAIRLELVDRIQSLNHRGAAVETDTPNGGEIPPKIQSELMGNHENAPIVI